MTSEYLLSPQRTLATVRAYRRLNLHSYDDFGANLAMRTIAADLFSDLRATRAWFAGKEAGWSPAERVRRTAINAGKIWSK